MDYVIEDSDQGETFVLGCGNHAYITLTDKCMLTHADRYFSEFQC